MYASELSVKRTVNIGDVGHPQFCGEPGSESRPERVSARAKARSTKIFRKEKLHGSSIKFNWQAAYAHNGTQGKEALKVRQGHKGWLQTRVHHKARKPC